MRLPKRRALSRHRSGEQALIIADMPLIILQCLGFDYNLLMWTSHLKDDVIRAPYPDVGLSVFHPRNIGASASATLLADHRRQHHRARSGFLSPSLSLQAGP
jgi:hypothetical protein